jgi:hypothetical protein
VVKEAVVKAAVKEVAVKEVAVKEVAKVQIAVNDRVDSVEPGAIIRQRVLMPRRMSPHRLTQIRRPIPIHLPRKSRMRRGSNRRHHLKVHRIPRLKGLKAKGGQVPVAHRGLELPKASKASAVRVRFQTGCTECSCSSMAR